MDRTAGRFSFTAYSKTPGNAEGWEKSTITSAGTSTYDGAEKIGKFAVPSEISTPATITQSSRSETIWVIILPIFPKAPQRIILTIFFTSVCLSNDTQLSCALSPIFCAPHEKLWDLSFAPGNPRRGFPTPKQSTGLFWLPSCASGVVRISPTAVGDQRRRLWNPQAFKKA